MTPQRGTGLTTDKLILPIQKLILHLYGLEHLIESPEELPANEIVAILLDAKSWPAETAPHWVIKKVSRLSVFFYQTAGNLGRWNPLLCSYREFKQLNKSTETWIDQQQYPPADAIEKWIRLQAEAIK